MGDLSITSLLSLAQFNGVNAKSCESGFGFDKTNDGFYFAVALGQCNMDAISFTGTVTDDTEEVAGEK